MEISKQINDLLEKYECTAKELANAAGLSVSVISRYRNGTRKPSEKQLEKLAEGFALLAKERNKPFDAREILSLSAHNNTDMDMFIRKFNILIATFEINISDFARFANYDPSFISRIRNQQRTISDSDSFAEKIGEFLDTKYRSKKYDDLVQKLTGDSSMTQSSENYIKGIHDWLLSYTAPIGNKIMPFTDILTDTNEELTVSDTAVPEFSGIRYYNGQDEIYRGELDFLKYALADPHITQLCIFNEMSHFIFRQKELADEWLALMSRIIRKGVTVTVIHNIRLPFSDIIVGIGKMFPLYMSGGMKPCYLPTARNNVYYHICGCTNHMVMYGEGVHGDESHVRLCLDRTPESIEYYKKEMDMLLKMSKPLMTIYQKSDEVTFRQFMKADSHTSGNRKGFYSSLPLHTMSEALLLSILERQKASENEKNTILEIYRETKENIALCLEHSQVTDEIFVLTEENFSEKAVPLTLSHTFSDRNFYYTYEEYLEHRRQTLLFAEQTPSYHVHFHHTAPLQNINIFIHEDKWAAISKTVLPATHFFIRHPDILRAMENISFFLSNPQ